jgi:hypothetical protein
VLALLGLAAGACSPARPTGKDAASPQGLPAGGSSGGLASSAQQPAAVPPASPVPPGSRIAVASPPGAVTVPGALSPAADAALIEWRRPWLVANPLGRSEPARPAEAGRPAPPPRSGPAAPPVVPAARAEQARPAPPAAQVGPPAAVPWERVSIGVGGLWMGPEAGPRAHFLFARRQRLEEIAQFARTWAPFRQIDAAGELVFRGRGAATASVAERRMIAEWTRLVAVEAADSAAPSAYGLAFAWHRGAATGGVCDDLAVYLSGEVRAGSCGAGTEVSGRLASERLERLYRWIDGLKAFQGAGEQGVRADALLERLIFAGRGSRQASPADLAAIEAFAGTLHRELTAGRPGVSPLPPGAASGGLVAALTANPPLPPGRQKRTDASPEAEETAAAETEAPAPTPTRPAFPLPDPTAESEDTHDADMPAPAAAAPPQPTAAPPPAAAAPQRSPTTPPPPAGQRKPPKPRAPAPPESSEPPPPPPPPAIDRP